MLGGGFGCSQTFFKKNNFFALLFHLVSCLLSPLVLSSLFSLFSSLFFFILSLVCSLVSPLSSSLAFLSCLVLSSFPVSLCLCLSLRVVLCCVVLCLVLWCVVCGVVCVVWHRENPVCTFKTCPCVPVPRAHVKIHVRVVPVHTVTFRTYTRARFEWTYGGEEEGHRQFCLPKFAQIGLSRDPEVHQKYHWISQISSLRTSREQHVRDSSNHSLYLMKLFVFRCPEGNKLLDCSIRFRPFLQA